MSRNPISLPYARRAGEDLLLHVRVQPRASRATVDGIAGDRLRLRVTAAPTDGEANAAVIELIAAHFDVPRSHVRLERGGGAREKTLRIVGGAALELAVASLSQATRRHP